MMNIPNRLTLLRVILTPLFAVFLMYPVFGEGEGDFPLSLFVGAVLFGIAAFTDFLDGAIARKHGIVTDFGIFLDPLADKFMVFVALISVCASDYIIPDGTLLANVFFWVTLLIIFRELAVTTMRLVAAGNKVVIPANLAGKIKTVTQILCIVLTVAEAIFIPDVLDGIRLFGLVSSIAAAVFTVWSGLNYFFAYKGFLGFGGKEKNI